jgi:hypothetical protein
MAANAGAQDFEFEGSNAVLVMGPQAAFDDRWVGEGNTLGIGGIYDSTAVDEDWEVRTISAD